MSLKAVAAMITPGVAVKAITVPMALAGVALSSDALHGNISKDFRKTFGFGRWFAPLVGVYEGAVAVLLWYDGGAHRALTRPKHMRFTRTIASSPARRGRHPQ